MRIKTVLGTGAAHQELRKMIKKDIFKNDIKARFKASANDRLHRFIMADQTIKGAIVHNTRMINEMRANHELGPLETLILGQAYIAATLMGATLKDKNDRLAMNIKCSGPVKGLDVEANVYGEVRGYLKTNAIEVKNPDQIRYLSTLYGAGFLTMTKYLENAPAPYSGQVALEHGSIAEDLANYYLVSEQIPTGFKLSIHFDESETVKGAGGIFLQALPGADPGKVIQAEKQIQAIHSLGEMFHRGDSPEQVIRSSFSGLEPIFLDNSRVEFFCRCSKERMTEYLKTLPEAERRDMKENGPFPLETRCHHCNSVYHFTRQEIHEL
ncbi:MAG: Hsp33 family molecular chaperone HslO [Desulfobacterales bacterium]|nr:Hsp33 family molecular chaperone HslO [Desulfobacterales bacterium]